MEYEDNKKLSLSDKLKRKFRLVIYKDEDFQPIYQTSYTKFRFLSIWITSGILIIAMIYSLIAFTPIRETIPGYPTSNLKRELIKYYKLTDSIEQALSLQDQYFESFRTAILGKEPQNLERITDSLMNLYESGNTTPIYEIGETEFYEDNDSYKYHINNDKKINANISSLLFFTPVKGMVTNKFNSQESHFGTDIVASSEEVVKATLPGTVTLATWTIETGHVIQVQHDHNIVSFYKHNAELLKKEGSHVDAGEPIAIIGNSGELTTGVHLHFELWHNMIPIDPELYIKF